MSLPASATTMPITSSPSSRVMALTPRAVLPIERASCSLKRMLMPFSVARMMSSLPPVIFTHASSSPSSRLMAIRPLLRTFM